MEQKLKKFLVNFADKSGPSFTVDAYDLEDANKRISGTFGNVMKVVKEVDEYGIKRIYEKRT